MKTRTGKKDIFSPTKLAGEKRPAPGRPMVHDEAWRKVTVVLFDRQLDALDRLALDIRAKTRASISRAEIIRALVDAMLESSLDLSDITSEGELKGRLRVKLEGSG